MHDTTIRRPETWIAFAPSVVVSIAHVLALAIGWDAFAAPSKLFLMPLLAAAVTWIALRNGAATGPVMLLLAAIGLSWLGDGAATFLPFMPELPGMLLCFGLAHLAYIALFWRVLARHRLPVWALVYALWWIAMLAVLWPRLGGLALAVAAYGIVLGGTAATAARCGPIVTIGGVFFLASDTILAFRLFAPETMPDWTSPLVMLTYALGQGLIGYGAVTTFRRSTR